MRGLVLAACLAMLTTAATPADAPAAPAPTPAAPTLAATVRSVTGTVEWRPSPDQPWQAVQVGQHLAQGADVRTGFRAACLLEMRGSLARMEPLSILRIGELRQEDGQVRTRLYLKQGNTQAVVDKAKAAADFAIITPSATLAVRGTHTIQVSHFGAFGSLFSLTEAGQCGLTGPLGQFLTLDPGQQTDGDLTMPAALLEWLRLLKIMDPYGFDLEEILAAARRGTTWPFPTDGPGGPPWNFFTNTPPPSPPCHHDEYLNGKGTIGP